MAIAEGRKAKPKQAKGSAGKVESGEPSHFQGTGGRARRETRSCFLSHRNMGARR
jgi:hypothetical protein